MNMEDITAELEMIKRQCVFFSVIAAAIDKEGFSYGRPVPEQEGGRSGNSASSRALVSSMQVAILSEVPWYIRDYPFFGLNV